MGIVWLVESGRLAHNNLRNYKDGLNRFHKMLCKYCGNHGCDDCMDITVAWEVYRNIPSPPHIKMRKKEGIVTPDYIRDSHKAR